VLCGRFSVEHRKWMLHFFNCLLLKSQTGLIAISCLFLPLSHLFWLVDSNVCQLSIRLRYQL
jgi:hypothetical protein